MKKVLSLLLTFLLVVPAWGLSEVHVIMGEESHAYEEDGKTLAKLEARFPQLVGMENTAAMDRVNEQIREYIRLEGGYDALTERASEDYRAGVDADGFVYSLLVTAEEKLHTDGVLTVLFSFSAYAGGAHGNEWLGAQQYDLLTGDILPIQALAGDADKFHAGVADRLLAQIDLLGLSEDMGYFDGFEETVRDWAFGQSMLTSEGYMVFFNPYEIAPFSSGTQCITLDYALVLPYLTGEARALIAP